MPNWNVYEQRSGELRFVGRLNNASSKEAISEARIAYPWVRWPIVHELDSNGKQIYRHDK